MKRTQLASLLLLAACSGGSGEDTDGSAAPTPAPSSTGPSRDTGGSTSVTTTNPAPAPSPFPACSPASPGPCALLDVTTETKGAVSPYLFGHVFVDATSVYWGTSSATVTAPALVYSVPKSGAPIGVDARVTVGEVDSLGQFVVGATSLVWTDYDGRLNSAPKTGGTAKQLATSSRIGPLALDATHVYFTEGMAVSRVPLDGGPVTSLATGLTCTSLVLWDADVYCRTPTDVVRFPKIGGAKTSVLHVDGNYLALTESGVYADNRVAGKEVVTLPFAGGTPAVVPVGTSDFDTLRAFGGALYFTDSGLAVRRAPLDGSPPSSVAMTGGFSARELAVDASGVYWADRRWTCLLQTYTRSSDRSDPGRTQCQKAVGQVRVVRLPLVF